MAVAVPYLIATSIAATAASTYVSVSSSRQAAANASTIGQINARNSLQYGEQNAQAALQQSEAEAAILEKQALASRLQAESDAIATRRQNERTAGTQRVSYLKSGVTLSGSANDVIYDSAIEGELDALNTEYKGRVSSQYYSDQAAYTRSKGTTEASLLRSKARMDAEAGVYEASSRASAYKAQATGSLLSGIGNMASSAASYGMWKTASPSFSGGR